ncbi:hypothetical protein HQ590_03025, partial [bacterium]|nr:hypothetical protein [bacterium]
PSCLGLGDPRVGEPEVADVTGPEGSEVEIIAQVDGQVTQGQVQRLAAGTNPAPDGVAEPPVLARQAMTSTKPGLWSGKFLLSSSGWYRIEFRNELGYANKRMTPGQFVAVPDLPPQINLERPGADVVLAPNGKLPLVVAASDDFGLSTVRVVVVHGPTNALAEVAPKTYAPGQVSDTIVTTLDLAPFDAKVGDVLRYRAEATDRKGQLVQTRDYLVRVAADADTADRQLAKFTEDQQFFADQLADLINTQDVVRARLDGLAVRYAPLMETLEVARAEFRSAPLMAVPGEPLPLTNATALAPPLQLDPISANLLQGLENRLGELAALQRTNALVAAQYFTALSNALAQAGALPVMPVQMTDQLRRLMQTFQQMVLSPMQALAGALQQAGAAGQVAPDMTMLQNLSAQLQRDLEAMRLSADEAAAASGLLGDDPQAALAQLEEARLRSEARLMGHELQGLHDELGSLLDELRGLQERQETLVEQTATVSGTNLPQVVRQQDQFDEELAPLLEIVQKIQEQQRLRRIRQPEFPAQPYAPDAEEYLVPPVEEDTPEESVTETNQPAGPSERVQKLKEQLEERLAKLENDETEEPLYAPALGGPVPKLDPRFADKRRPVPPAPATGVADPEADEISRQQWLRVQELDLASQSVAADRATAAALLNQLLAATNQPNPARSQSPPDAPAPSAGAQLADMMRSQAMQQALDMAGQLEH